MFLVPLHFSCHVFSIYSLARTTIVKMDVAKKSLLLLLLLLLLKSRTSRNSFSQATHSVSSKNNEEHNQGRE